MPRHIFRLSLTGLIAATGFVCTSTANGANRLSSQ